MVFSAAERGIFDLYRKPLGRSEREQLVYNSDNDKFANHWSNDGRYVLFAEDDPKTRRDLWVLSLADLTAQPLVQTEASESDGFFSPDGQWLAYESDESGRQEVYVQPFQRSGSRTRLSRDGGGNAAWHPSGKEVFFLSQDRAVMSVEVEIDGAGFKATPPKPLLRLPLEGPGSFLSGFGVSADGKRFLMDLRVPGPDADAVTVVLNWTSLLGQDQK